MIRSFPALLIVAMGPSCAPASPPGTSPTPTAAAAPSAGAEPEGEPQGAPVPAPSTPDGGGVPGSPPEAAPEAGEAGRESADDEDGVDGPRLVAALEALLLGGPGSAEQVAWLEAALDTDLMGTGLGVPAVATAIESARVSLAMQLLDELDADDIAQQYVRGWRRRASLRDPDATECVLRPLAAEVEAELSDRFAAPLPPGLSAEALSRYRAIRGRAETITWLGAIDCGGPFSLAAGRSDRGAVLLSGSRGSYGLPELP